MTHYIAREKQVIRVGQYVARFEFGNTWTVWAKSESDGHHRWAVTHLGRDHALELIRRARVADGMPAPWPEWVPPWPLEKAAG